MKIHPMRIKYNTTSAYVSGGICGHLWANEMACAGRLVKKSLRGVWGFMERDRQNPESFRDALDRLLFKEGGDFRDARFTADTVLRVERRTVIDEKGKYAVHVFERELIELWNCRDLVNESCYVSDFLGENE
jgi:hypothetical protein